MYAQQYFVYPINVIISIFFLTLIPRNYAEDDYAKLYLECKRTADLDTCGTWSVPGYPFWVDGIQPANCGVEEFKLSCDQYELFTNFGSDSKYRVTHFNLENSIFEVERADDLVEDICASDTNISSTILNEKPFKYGNNTEGLHFFYDCPTDIYMAYVGKNFTCPSGDTDRKVIFGNESFLKAQRAKLSLCQYITVPVRKIEPEESPENVLGKLRELLQKTFEVHYHHIHKTACYYCTKNDWLCWRNTSLPKNKTCLSEHGLQFVDEAVCANDLDVHSSLAIPISVHSSNSPNCVNK